MDLFERLRRATGDIPWDTFVSVMAQNLGANGAAAQEIIAQTERRAVEIVEDAKNAAKAEGDRMRVELMSVDVERGFIDFRNAGVSRLSQRR